MLKKKAINQHSILELLAGSPDLLIKPMSKRLAKDYKSINEAVHSLEERNYITGIVIKKTRRGLIKEYRLTEKGMAYAMAYGDEKILHQALINYEKHLPNYKEYLQLTNLLSQKTMAKLLRLAGKATLGYGRVAKAEDWLTLIGSHWARFTSSERREIKRAAHEVESVKRGIQKAAKDLYKFAFPDE
ncbi:hypothetical protein KAU88_07910 [Candidatus Bathyarchaeota archaeon]|nr:hypothetical protein [Candidatus Bathyarchaeota archaeon]